VHSMKSTGFSQNIPVARNGRLAGSELPSPSLLHRHLFPQAPGPPFTACQILAADDFGGVHTHATFFRPNLVIPSDILRPHQLLFSFFSRQFAELHDAVNFDGHADVTVGYYWPPVVTHNRREFARAGLASNPIS